MACPPSAAALRSRGSPDTIAPRQITYDLRFSESAEALERAARRVEQSEKDLTALAEHLSEVSMTLTAKMASTGRFYGAITSSMIADELARLTDREIDRRTINLAEPIHEPGEHQVEGAKLALGHAYGGAAQYFAMWVVSSEMP